MAPGVLQGVAGSSEVFRALRTAAVSLMSARPGGA